MVGEYSDDDEEEDGEEYGVGGEDIKFNNFNNKELLSSLIELI